MAFLIRRIPPVTYLSYYQNVPTLIGSTTWTLGNSIHGLAPFILEYPLSASYLRFPVTIAMTSTTMSTGAASASGGLSISGTYNFGIYSRMTGGASNTLQYVASTSVGSTWGVSYSVAANGTQASSTYGISFNQTGVNTNTTFGVSESTNSYRLYTSNFSNFSSLQMMDVPFGVSLSPGQYFLAMGNSTTRTTSGGTTADLTGFSIDRSYHGVTQVNNAYIAPMGSTSNSSMHLIPGLGSWSTNSANVTTAYYPMSQISTSASNVLPFFLAIRVT